ncbi:MAG: hypothetical protein V7L17_04300 [Nostoc sp.]
MAHKLLHLRVLTAEARRSLKFCLNHWRNGLYSDRLDRCIGRMSYF